ncbi:MAG: murein biosynthesis integral membrane protein MurJ [Deltaproteobacteria bacterium]|nr:murein biosynthesis integral membrane protein MurJ [Deltaproteobacteria bacterium]
MSEESTARELGRVAKATGIVGSMTLLSRFSGLARDIVIGYLLGARSSADAFFVAFRIPNLLRRLTAEGALSAGFVPVLSQILANQGRREAIEASRVLMTFAVLVLLVVTAAGVLLPGPLTWLFAPGFSAAPEKFSLTVRLVRIMFPSIFFLSLVALCMGYLNTFRHFMAPALAPVLQNLSIIAAAFLLIPLLSQPVMSLAYGVLLGGAAQLALQLPFLRRHGFSWMPSTNFRSPALSRFLWLMGPAVIGAAVYQLNVLVSTILASLLEPGSVSYLYYADRLLQFPLGVFAVALGTAALPSFSSLAARQDVDGLRTTLGYSLRMVNFISLPSALGLMVVAVPAFSLLFQRGAFGPADVAASARALIFLALGLWAISATRVLVPIFHAMQDTRTPMRVALCTFVLNFLLSLALMGPVGTAGAGNAFAGAVAGLGGSIGVLSLSYAGLALANSLSATFQFAVLLWLMTRRLGSFAWRDYGSSLWRNFAAATVMAGSLALVAGRVPWGSATLFAQIPIFVGLLAGGVVLYAAAANLLRSPDWPLARKMGISLLERLPILHARK